MAKKPKSGKEKEGGTTGRKASGDAFKREPALKQGDEKVLIIPLRHKARRSAKNKRMNRSVREIKLFLAKHMGTELSNVSISQQLNEFLWKGGFHNPPSKIRVKVSSDEEGNVLARLVDRKEKKSKLGLRERLAKRREGAKEEEKKSEDKKPEEKKPAEKRTEPAKERPVQKDSGEKATKSPSGKESPPEEQVEQGILLEQ